MSILPHATRPPYAVVYQLQRPLPQPPINLPTVEEPSQVGYVSFYQDDQPVVAYSDAVACADAGQSADAWYFDQPGCGFQLINNFINPERQLPVA